MPHVTDRDTSWTNTVTDVAPAERRQAARTVAAHASDATECRTLLDMLGLHPREGAADVDS